MANTKNITLDQLQMAMERIKAFTEATYSHLGHVHTTGEVTKLEGYVISAEGESTGSNMRIALAATDTLNEALGKLDRSIYNIVENIGSIDVENHVHDEIYYRKEEIDKFVDDLEKADEDNLTSAMEYTDNKVSTAISELIDGAPEALDTLKEIADSLGNDDDIAGTIVEGLAQKVTGPETAVSGNVMIFDGSTGKLAKDSTFSIGCSVPADALFTDHNVLTSPMASASLYLAGTTRAVGETNTLGINPSVFIDGANGKLVAPVFLGDLEGRATVATTADTAVKTQAALTVKLNGEDAGVFNGNTAISIDVTPDAIGAHAKDYTQKATDDEVDNMLTSLFGA